MCADCGNAENISALLSCGNVDLLLTDPPYGINYGKQLKKEHVEKRFNWRRYKSFSWDEKRPSSFEHLLAVSKNQIIWGGNYFADLLPPRSCWLIWDKGQRGFSLADGELAWTSFKKALRIIKISRALANSKKRYHPTQKPVELLVWCLNVAKRYGGEIKTVFDAYAGSGSTIIACEQTGKTCFSMDISPIYCDIAINRFEELTGVRAELLSRT